MRFSDHAPARVGPKRRGRILAITLVAPMIGTATGAEAAPSRIFAAGSLADAMTAQSAASGVAPDAFDKPVFGPAGLLGDRLQKGGEAADIFISADLAAPLRVAAARSGALVVPFVRNRMCVAAKPSVGLTASNMLDKMLAPDLRLATSTPGNDPGGDYAVAVFGRADALRPGAGKVLTDKALHLVGGPNTMVPIDGRSPAATSHRVATSSGGRSSASGRPSTARPCPRPRPAKSRPRPRAPSPSISCRSRRRPCRGRPNGSPSRALSQAR